MINNNNNNNCYYKLKLKNSYISYFIWNCYIMCKEHICVHVYAILWVGVCEIYRTIMYNRREWYWKMPVIRQSLIVDGALDTQATTLMKSMHWTLGWASPDLTVLDERQVLILDFVSTWLAESLVAEEVKINHRLSKVIYRKLWFLSNLCGTTSLFTMHRTQYAHVSFCIYFFFWISTWNYMQSFTRHKRIYLSFIWNNFS